MMFSLIHPRRSTLRATVLCALFGVALVAHAQEPTFYFSSTYDTLASGSEFEIILLIRAPHPVNAFDVAFTYPNHQMQPISFNNGASIIDVWQSQPAATDDGTIRFSGGITSGWSGNRGILLAVRFRAVGEGDVLLRYITAEAYRADGKGTRTNSTSEGLSLRIQEGALREEIPLPSDSMPPVIRFASLVRDPLTPEQILLSYFVYDAGSGVKETRARVWKFFRWSPWQSVQNPTALEAGIWAAELQAVDNQGNEKKIMLYHMRALFSLAGMFAVTAILLIACIIAIRRSPPRPARNAV